MRGCSTLSTCALLGMLLTLAHPIPAHAASILDGSGLRLVYHEDFEGGSLAPEADRFGGGTKLLEGIGAPDGDGGITLSVTGGPSGLASTEALLTGLSFGRGDVFGLRLSFAVPALLTDDGDVSAVAALVRTSDPDAFTAATFQYTGTGSSSFRARLNTPGSPGVGGDPIVGYDPRTPPPDVTVITLEAIFDRRTESLAAAVSFAGRSDLDTTRSATFNPLVIGPDDPFTSIGFAVAIASVSGGVEKTASVRVLDFQVFVPEPGAGAALLVASLLAVTRRRGLAPAARSTPPCARPHDGCVPRPARCRPGPTPRVSGLRQTVRG